MFKRIYKNRPEINCAYCIIMRFIFKYYAENDIFGQKGRKNRLTEIGPGRIIQLNSL